MSWFLLSAKGDTPVSSSSRCCEDWANLGPWWQACHTDSLRQYLSSLLLISREMVSQPSLNSHPLKDSMCSAASMTWERMAMEPFSRSIVRDELGDASRALDGPQVVWIQCKSHRQIRYEGWRTEKLKMQLSLGLRKTVFGNPIC